MTIAGLTPERGGGNSSGAAGKPLDIQVVHIWDFPDGKLVRWQQYTGTWQFAQVAGVTLKS